MLQLVDKFSPAKQAEYDKMSDLLNKIIDNDFEYFGSKCVTLRKSDNSLCHVVNIYPEPSPLGLFREEITYDQNGVIDRVISKIHYQGALADIQYLVSSGYTGVYVKEFNA